MVCATASYFEICILRLEGGLGFWGPRQAEGGLISQVFDRRGGEGCGFLPLDGGRSQSLSPCVCAPCWGDGRAFSVSGLCLCFFTAMWEIAPYAAI